MKLGKLVTYSFDKNVGRLDRMARIALGAGLVALAWLANSPPGFKYAIGVAGVMTLATGLVSRCALYYMLGVSTCPTSNKPWGIEK